MDKMRQWTMLTLISVVVIVAAGWFLVVSKQKHKAAELRTQVTGQQATNAGLQSQVSQLEQQKKGLPAQQALLARAAQRIPDNPALPALIRQLSTAADATCGRVRTTSSATRGGRCKALRYTAYSGPRCAPKPLPHASFTTPTTVYQGSSGPSPMRICPPTIPGRR